MNTMLRRKNSSLYSPSPLSRSQVQADNDRNADSPDSTQVMYNHITDRTASPEQLEYRHGSEIGSASTVSPASTLSDADIGYPLERVERVGNAGLFADFDPSWPTSLTGSRSSSVESTSNDYMYASPNFASTLSQLYPFSDFDELVESLRKMEICPYMTQDLYVCVHLFFSCSATADVYRRLLSHRLPLSLTISLWYE